MNSDTRNPLMRYNSVTPSPTSLSSFAKRSFHRLAFVLGLGGAAFLAYHIYSTKFMRRCPSESSTKDNKSVRISKIVEVNEGGVVSSTETNLESKSSVTTDSIRRNVQIILHQTPRGYFVPCIAPFSLKLETYLRVANIGYEVDFTSSSGDDKNTPWITIDGEEFSESHNCISKLDEIFHIDLDANAVTSRKIASRLVEVMLEQHIYWGISLWRWVHDEGRSLPQIQPLTPSEYSVIAHVSAAVEMAAWFHGLGRLSPKQVTDQILKDLGDLSSALGKHSYFLGETPGEVDCEAFSLLSQMIWSMPGSPFESAIKQHRNLLDFVLRMRDNYWPDWEKHLQCLGEENSENGMIPGAEFLTTRQLNSESSQWDSKTTSTATLRGQSTDQLKESSQHLMQQVVPLDGVNLEEVNYCVTLDNPTSQRSLNPILEESSSRKSMGNTGSDRNMSSDSQVMASSAPMPSIPTFELSKQNLPFENPLDPTGLTEHLRQHRLNDRMEMAKNILMEMQLQEINSNQLSPTTIQEIINQYNSYVSHQVPNYVDNLCPPQPVPSLPQQFSGNFQENFSQVEFQTPQPTGPLYPQQFGQPPNSNLSYPHQNFSQIYPNFSNDLPQVHQPKFQNPLIIQQQQLHHQQFHSHNNY